VRVTINIPIHIYKRLLQEKLNRNSNGFSKIIIEALEKYFHSKSNDRESIIKRLKGSQSFAGRAKALKDLCEWRSNIL